MKAEVLYIDRQAPVRAGDDGMVHVAPFSGLPAMVLPRKAAIANGRALLAAVAELEKREGHTPAPASIVRKARREAGH